MPAFEAVRAAKGGNMSREVLLRQLDYYKIHQQEFLKDYNGKVLLIQNEQLVKTFDDRTSAYQYGKKNLDPGTYFIIKCTPGDKEYTVNYASVFRFPKMVTA